MNNKVLKFLVGFLVLFGLYHAAEYFVIKRYNAGYFVLIQSFFFAASWLIAKWQGFRGISAWALKPTKGWFLQWVCGMATGILLYSLSFYIAAVVNGNLPVIFPTLRSVIKPLALFGFGTFLSSLSEDILTRGYLFRHIRPKVPSGLFIFVSAALYLFNHIYRLADGMNAIGYLFLLGILFAMPLVYSERLWFTTGMHWMGNLTFYFSANLLKINAGDNLVQPNTVFIICILFMIPIFYLLLPKIPFMRSQESIVIEAIKQQTR